MSLFYTSQDMAKIACNDCRGCHDCCTQMGDTVVLNPLDVYRLHGGLGQSFQELLYKKIDLHVEEGMILLHMIMEKESNNCVFLNENGRCSIHSFRPGLCRLFPLGRNYTKEGFQYFIVEGACSSKVKSKVKIQKWLQEEDLKRQEEFVLTWHRFVRKVQGILQAMEDEQQKKTINLFLLQEFYGRPYDLQADFYIQFEQRMQKIEAVLV